MKAEWMAVLFLCVGCSVHSASAHYIFSTLITGSGKSSTAAVRLPGENGPIHDITSTGARCNVGLSPATETVTVAAGSVVGFKLDPGKTVFHQGPAAMYLGRAPGKAADWDGSGSSWFKIAEWGATFNPFNFISHEKSSFTATIPSSVPSGEYLLRIEQWGLHIPGSPETFIECAQITITNGGNGSPNMVSIPGYIAKDDPMVMLDIFWPIPTSYKVPGPAVYSDGSKQAPLPTTPTSTVHRNQTSPSKPCRRRTPIQNVTIPYAKQLHRRKLRAL